MTAVPASFAIPAARFAVGEVVHAETMAGFPAFRILGVSAQWIETAADDGVGDVFQFAGWKYDLWLVSRFAEGRNPESFGTHSEEEIGTTAEEAEAKYFARIQKDAARRKEHAMKWGSDSRDLIESRR